jgi:hypothetical protein
MIKVIEKRAKFVMVNHLKTISSVTSPCGSIAVKESHTPVAHHILISSEDLLFTTRTISGMFQKGRAMPASNDRLDRKLTACSFHIRTAIRQGMFFYKVLYWYASKTIAF